MAFKTKPPLGTVQIDQGHPLASNLSLYALFNEGGGVTFDIIKPTIATFGAYSGSNPTWTITSEGSVITGVSGSSFLTNRLSEISGDTSGTVFWRSYTTDAFNNSAQRYIWGSQSSGGGTPEISCQKYSDNNWYVGWNTSADRRVTLAASSSNWVQNAWSSYVFTWSTTAGSVLYQSGLSIGSNGSGVVTAAINNITLLSSTNIEIGTTGFNGSISIWGYYRNRVLTPSEALWISKEPYAMLRPTIRTRYFIPSAVAGTTPLSYSFSDNLNDEVIA